MNNDIIRSIISIQFKFSASSYFLTNRLLFQETTCLSLNWLLFDFLCFFYLFISWRSSNTNWITLRGLFARIRSRRIFGLALLRISIKSRGWRLSAGIDGTKCVRVNPFFFAPIKIVLRAFKSSHPWSLPPVLTWASWQQFGKIDSTWIKVIAKLPELRSPIIFACDPAAR